MADRRTRQAQGAIAQKLAETSFIKSGYSYFSHVRLVAEGTVDTGVTTYVIPAGFEVEAFSYQKGQDMGIAGRPGVFARECDTNIQSASETLDSEVVEILGVKGQITALSDAELASRLCRETSVKISLNGGKRTELLGNMEMLPGGTGLYAPAAGAPASTAVAVSVMTAGLPDYRNFMPLPGGLLWQPKGESDSSLVIKLRVEREVTFETDNADAPEDIFVDYRLEFVCRQWADRSPNS